MPLGPGAKIGFRSEHFQAPARQLTSQAEAGRIPFPQLERVSLARHSDGHRLPQAENFRDHFVPLRSAIVVSAPELPKFLACIVL